MTKPPLDREVLAVLWKTRTVPYICTVLGIGRRRLYHYVKKYNLGPKPAGTHGLRDGIRRADPTPEEIREYTLSLQATWSDAERERRAGRSKAGAAARSMGYDGRGMRFSEKLM